jgi:hypothetical protein
VIADFYHNNATNCTAAFSVAAFFNGYASAIGYFCYLSIPRKRMAEMIIFSTVVSTLFSQASFIVQLHQQKQEEFVAKQPELKKKTFEQYKARLNQSVVDKYHRETDNVLL